VHAYVVNNFVQEQLLLQLIIIYDDFLEPMAFFNPEIPELEEAQSPDFGIENVAGIPGFGISVLQSLRHGSTRRCLGFAGQRLGLGLEGLAHVTVSY